MKIFSGSSNKLLAERIARTLGITLSSVEVFTFPDGERRVRVEENVVDQHCVVVQSTSTPVAEHVMELFFLIDALKRNGASEVTCVIPYLGYQRQDHIFRTGEAVSLEVTITLLESLRVDRVVGVDFHSIKIPEMFSIPVSHLSGLPLFVEKIRNVILEGASPIGSLTSDRDSITAFQNDYLRKSILVSPDMGGLRRINQISDVLQIPWIATVKDRDLATGSIEITTIEGELGDRKEHAFIVDDMISSGGTVIKSAALLKKNGVKQVSVFVTHAIFSQEAPKLLQESAIDKVYVTDSVFVPKEKHFPKLTILSTDKMIAKDLKILHTALQGSE